jgi:hypothetical protein
VGRPKEGAPAIGPMKRTAASCAAFITAAVATRRLTMAECEL